MDANKIDIHAGVPERQDDRKLAAIGKTRASLKSLQTLFDVRNTQVESKERVEGETTISITDVQGAAVSNAKLVYHDERGKANMAISNSEGVVVLKGIKETVNITISANGYKIHTQSGVLPGSRLEVVLTPGSN